MTKDALIGALQKEYGRIAAKDLNEQTEYLWGYQHALENAITLAEQLDD